MVRRSTLMGAGPLNQYTMASLVGSYIQVENQFLQIILNTLLFSALGFMFTLDYKKMCSKILDFFNISEHWRKFWKDPTRPTIKFQGSIRQGSQNMHCTPELSAWLHHIQQMIEQISGESHVISGSEYVLRHLQIQAKDHIAPAQNQEFDIGDDIRCEFRIKEVSETRAVKNQGGVEITSDRYSLVLSTTPDRGLQHLLTRTKEVVQKYSDFKSKKLMEKPCLFVYQGGIANKASSWKKEEFSSSRKVEHIWIEDRDKLFAAYDTFLNDREFFEARGDPWTFNALLYGPPGCGKTSLLKALVNYDLARGKVCHLIVVPVSNIKNADEFRDLMFNPVICGFEIPFEDRIYIFEDFDACKQSSVFNIRKKLQKKTGDHSSDEEDDEEWEGGVANANTQMMQMLIEHITDKKMQDMNRTRKKKVSKLRDNGGGEDAENEEMEEDPRDMNLCTILNALDGINERTGQRCFWTTNLDPPSDHFDPAFLRPGRIDMMIRFDRAPVEGVRFLLESHFRETVTLEMLQEIADGRHFTPAEIKQFCRQSQDVSTAIKYMQLSLEKTLEKSEKAKHKEEEARKLETEKSKAPRVVTSFKRSSSCNNFFKPPKEAMKPLTLRKVPSAGDLLVRSGG